MQKEKEKEKMIWYILIYFRQKLHSGPYASQTRCINFSIIILLSLYRTNSYIVRLSINVIQ